MGAVRSSAFVRGGAIAAACFAAQAVPAAAQDSLASMCETVFVADARAFCARIGEAAEVTQARVGMGFTGGNPVPGTGSTLGRRIRKVPRVSVAARITGVDTDLPPISSIDANDEIGFVLPTFNIDAGVGILNGVSLGPTIGGFGSADLLLSYGLSSLPGDDGFEDSPSSWGIGARIGILRESFTVPGVSVSAMYRGISDIEFGDPALERSAAFFGLTDNSVLSLRGTVGKRILTLGATAGIGYDRYKSDVEIALENPDDSTIYHLTETDMKTDRTTIFGNLSWSMLVLHISGEVGWQSGGDDFPSPTNFDSQSGKGAWYGSLAVRLSI